MVCSACGSGNSSCNSTISSTALCTTTWFSRYQHGTADFTSNHGTPNTINMMCNYTINMMCSYTINMMCSYTIDMMCSIVQSYNLKYTSHYMIYYIHQSPHSNHPTPNAHASTHVSFENFSTVTFCTSKSHQHTSLHHLFTVECVDICVCSP